MKNVLLVVHTNTWFTEMYRVAKLMTSTSEFKPIVHFAYHYPTIEADQAKLKKIGVEFTTSWQLILNPKKKLPEKLWLRLYNLIFRIIRSRRLTFLTSYFSFIFLLLDAYNKSKSEILYYRNLIVDKRVDLVVMAGDLVGYNTLEIVKSTHLEKKSCVIIPSTMSDGTEQAEAYYFDKNFSCEKPFNKLAGWLWPKWKKFHKGKWLIRLPAEQVFVRQFLDLDPPLPWVSSSSRADVVAVESKAMKDYYLRCGIESSVLSETGTIANDYLSETTKNSAQLRKKLFNELELDVNKKTILTALPPDFLYMPGGRPDCEFSTYKELTIFWTQSLAKADKFNVVISLHPSVDIEEFRYLESTNVKIAKLSIVDLIPLCDIFVASVSSTIRWAIACAKPVLNFDVYVYRYVDFMSVKGVLYFDKSKDFLEAINKINTDDYFLKMLNEQIQSEAAYWGNLDGNEGRRILDLFNAQIAKARKES